MVYAKPQIMAVSDTFEAIKSLDIPKGASQIQDHTALVYASQPAYEADE
ncbi:MAG: hypothetical protein WA634_02425 [Silvibacterium sp.]